MTLPLLLERVEKAQKHQAEVAEVVGYYDAALHLQWECLAAILKALIGARLEPKDKDDAGTI